MNGVRLTTIFREFFAMFFQVWFLYVIKLGLIGFVLVFVSSFMGANHEVVKTIGLSIVVPVCLVGAMLGVILPFRSKIQCPRCYQPSGFILIGPGRPKPGVQCERCGIVYVRNLFTDFHVSVMPDDSDSDAPNI